MRKQTTVGKYLISRLEEIGLRHVFGIPGDYVLKFYDRVAHSSLKLIGTSTEQGAAFAADAYARVNGLGCICVTYCVGGLNVINAVAGAYAEKSPLIVISGAPGFNERVHSHLLHHLVKDYDSQCNIFKEVTIATAQLKDAYAAPDQIDEVITACIKHKRPVYIELPRDLVDQPCIPPTRVLNFEPAQSDPETLVEALKEATDMLKAAKNPVILGCIEIHRYGLQQQFLKLLEVTGYPCVSTLTGKSIISEHHPQYAGAYVGAVGRESTRKLVEESDCLLMLGAIMNDLNMGTAQLRVSKTINATSEDINIKYHHYKGINLGDFITGLAESLQDDHRKTNITPRTTPDPYDVEPPRQITSKRLFNRINHFIAENCIVISDVGDCLFAAADLVIPDGTRFLGPAYYASMGFGVPAAIGAQINKPHLRPIILVGDGAFQMTCQELSTILRCGLNPIVFIVNNKGYLTQRFIQDGYFNDIHDWAYHKWPELLNGGMGVEVKTEGELEVALEQAKSNIDSFTIVNVHLGKYDSSEALTRLCKYLGSKAGTKVPT